MGKVFTITQGLENMGALRSGGQGSVYKGRRIGEIFVAVKLLPTPIHTESEDDKHFRDFRSEVEKLKKVNENPTPHVVKILSSGITESGSLPYIEMEFIEGPDLGELLNEPNDPVFTIPEVIKVADQLAAALSHCHKVGVKHGDIKSNNVKFNKHTGNYVLLDFGLAIMSDEQRRDSLRNAGAVEFMAPEQNEGVMLPHSDVYSYGIILYELLAGVVPFPLTGNAQSARNNVMLAHMESAIPDLLTLRGQNLPQSWSAEKRELEMQVPEWLLTVIAKCLQKDPADRFNDGAELHQAILSRHSSLTIKNNNERALVLQTENDSLQAAFQQERQKASQFEQELKALKESLAQKDQQLAALKSAPVSNPSPASDSHSTAKGMSVAAVMGIGLLMVCVGAFAGHVLFPAKGKDNQTRPDQTVTAATKEQQPATKTEKPKADEQVPEETTVVPVKKPSRDSVRKRDSIRKKDTTTKVAQQPTAQPQAPPVTKPSADKKGKDAGHTFTLFATYAFFHDSPDAASVRKANINRWNNARLKAIDDINGYIYVIYKNDQGQVSKGWLDKRDLIRVD